MSLNDLNDPENRDALYELEMARAELDEALARNDLDRAEIVEIAIRYWKAKSLSELCNPTPEHPPTSA